MTSGEARGGFDVLFSAANIESGRRCGPPDPRDVGLCCHDSVPAREMEVLGEEFEDVESFEGDLRGSRGVLSLRLDMSLGLAGSMFGLRRPDADSLNSGGNFTASSRTGVLVADLSEAGVPKLEEESLVGERERARSVGSI